MKSKFTFSIITILIFLTGCQTSAVSNSSQIFELGDYKFNASSVEKIGGICLFDGISAYKGDKQRDKLLVIHDNCAVLAKGMNLIWVDANVDLSVADYHKLLLMLRASAEASCKKNQNVLFIVCLNEGLLNSVSKEKSEYIFWYGRVTNAGSKGVGVRIVRSNGRFEFSQSGKSG